MARREDWPIGRLTGERSSLNPSRSEAKAEGGASLPKLKM
nr:MAG TPA: hypothetical protein [Caudoviricetes sp.]